MVDLTERIEEHKRQIAKKTMSIKEFAEIEGISENKARQLSHAENFPVLVIGHQRRIIISKLDSWLETHIGTEI